MKSFIIQSLSLTALLTIVGCSKPVPGARDSVEPITNGGRDSVELEPALATVNGTSITEADFRRYWDKQQPAVDDAATRAAILDEAVERQVLVQRARALGLADDPIVREAIESALIARLKEQEQQPAIAAAAVSDEALRAAYDSQRATRFTISPQVRVAVLWLNSRGQEQLEARYQPRLKALAAEIAAVPAADGFGKLAIANTEHRASRYRGGIIAPLEVGASYSDAWRQQVLALAAELAASGDLSPVTSNKGGTFLVRLIERTEASIRPFDQVKASLRDELLRQQRQEAIAAFDAENRQAVTVTQFPERLDLLAPLPTPPREQTPPSLFAGEVSK